MNRRISNTQCHLRNHSTLFGQYHRTFKITMIIKSAERTGNIRSLLSLHFIHQLSNILRYSIHPQGIKSSLQQMSLNTDLVKRGSPFTDSLVRILSKEQVNLLKSSSIGLNSIETAHIYNNRCDLLKLVNLGNILSRRLPHIPVNKGKFNLFFH